MFFIQSWKFEVYQLIKTANCNIDLSYKIIETDSHNKNVNASISRVLQNFKLILFFSIYCITKILTICNIFLFKFTASNLYCLWQPAENHKSDGQAPY